jgi:hypothetical protein
MSNNPILPIVPDGAAPLDDSSADDESLLQVNNPALDDGETTDSEDTVDEDVREAENVNANIED